MEPVSRPQNESVASAFDRRSARARALLPQAKASRDVLAFAAELFRAQAQVALGVADAHTARPLSGDLARDLPAFEERLDVVLHVAREQGPPPLRDAARRRRAEASGALLTFWNQGGSGRRDYLSRALLRPYAEVLNAIGVLPRRPAVEGACPFCKSVAAIAFRQSGGDFEGTRRLLGCALCNHAWPLPRILCATCGEERPDKLPGFQSDRHPATRIEACATCRTYMKSIDLTIDARAIPEVDDLVSLSLDVWAHDQGYARLEPGLAGI